MNNRIREMTYAGLLTALAIIIPIQFAFLKIYIPPFSAIVVGIGSTLGFLISGVPMPIVARATTHIIIGYIGAKIIIKNKSYLKSAAITAPIHGLLEAIIVIPFIGFDLYQLLIVTAVGGFLHHCVDSIIAYVIATAIAKASKKDIYTVFGKLNASKMI